MAEEFKFKDKKKLDPAQKIVAGVLVVATFIVLIFSLNQFSTNIKKPFQAKKINESKNSDTQKIKDNDILILQGKDSDKDGLSDYDEMYVYQTMPYNNDSDSDGIDDKKEIEIGSNPICPKGQNCGSVNNQNIQPDNHIDKTEDMFDTNFSPEIGEVVTDLKNEEVKLEELQSILTEDLPVSEIKNLLKQSGMPDEILNQFTDEQLQKAYKEVLGDMN